MLTKMQEYSRRYYLSHREKILEKRKKYYQEHREERIAYAKLYQIKNPPDPEDRKIINRKFYLKKHKISSP